MLVSATGATEEHAYLEIFKGQVLPPNCAFSTMIDIMQLLALQGLEIIE